MHDRRRRCRPQQKYHPSSTPLTSTGVALLVLGIVLLLWCIPEWAWAALAALGLIAAGLLLILLGRR